MLVGTVLQKTSRGCGTKIANKLSSKLSNICRLKDLINVKKYK